MFTEKAKMIQKYKLPLYVLIYIPQSKSKGGKIKINHK